MKYSELLQELHSLKGKTLITFHSLGDVEAVASGVALSKLIANNVVKSPDRTNSSSRHLVEKLGIEKIPVLKKGEVNDFNNIVLVDVANKEMLGEFGEEVKKFKGRIIAIDHHEHGKLLKGKIFEFPHRTSCCEVIFDLYRVSGKKIEPVIATLLLAGIVSDTARFKTANKQTFHAVSQLMSSSDVKYEDILSITKGNPDASEVKNVLKAMQSAELRETQAGIIGIAKNNAFEAKSALALVEIGCIVGICFNEKNGKIAMVKDSENPNAKNIDVGKMMKSAGREMKGSGGGHESVGGAIGKPELTKKTAEKIVEKLKSTTY